MAVAVAVASAVTVCVAAATSVAVIMAVIGRRRAVADVFNVKMTGMLAWMAWLFIHLVQIIGFGNRLLVLVQWAWNYLTFGRAARLITGQAPTTPPLDEDTDSE